MRPRQLRLIVSFHTTTAAMAMERYCLEKAVPGRLIPIPREITAGCGMAWSAPPEEKETVLRAAAQGEIEIAGTYVLEI
jgi:hypothetical protein